MLARSSFVCRTWQSSEMEPAIKLKYSNIGRKAIEVYCETCSRCVESAPREQQRAEYKPIVTKGFNRRCQIDLIDMQSNQKGGMSWLAVYQHHGLKFAYFRALPDKKTPQWQSSYWRYFVFKVHLLCCSRAMEGSL